MDCVHEFIEDEFYVCKKCGTVDSDILTQPNIPHMEKYYHNYVSNPILSDIVDVVFYFNLSSDLIEYLVEKVSKDERTDLTIKEKIAIQFYLKMIEDGNCIRLHEICQVCDVKIKKINKYLENKCEFFHEDILNKACKNLNLSNDEMHRVKERLQSKTITGHNPCTEIGGYLYDTFKNKLNINDVSNVVNINPCSIRRYIRNVINKECINSI